MNIPQGWNNLSLSKIVIFGKGGNSVLVQSNYKTPFAVIVLHCFSSRYLQI